MAHRLIKAAKEAAQMAKDHTMTDITEAQIAALKEVASVVIMLTENLKNLGGGYDKGASLIRGQIAVATKKLADAADAATILALLAENAKLREALKPFASYANTLSPSAWKDNFGLEVFHEPSHDSDDRYLSVIDLRRARAALGDKTDV